MTKRAGHLRRIGRYCLFAGVAFLLLLVGLLWYVNTDSFQQMVRGRLITGIERATGGRVEVGSFHVVPFRLQVEVRNLTIHGRESADEVPYVHVDSMIATVKLSSVLGAKIGFHSLTLQRPVVHIIFYPDGTTNHPTPKEQSGSSVEQLFAISIGRLEVQNGVLLWQDQSLPLDFSTNDISASMAYSFLHQRYSGKLEIGKAETRFDGYRPVAWSGQSAFTLDRDGAHVTSLKATSGSSRLLANGTIVNFASPELKGSYDILMDVTDAGAVSRDPQFKAGKLSLIGSGSWSRQGFSSTGTFGLRDLVFQNQSVSAKEVSASGKFSIDPHKILLSKVEGRGLHGSFTSEAEIDGWQYPRKRVLNPNAKEGGEFEIRVKDASLAEALASLGPQFRPESQLRFAGSVSGIADIKWKDSIRDAHTRFTATVERPTRLSAGQIPLAASASGTYDARTRDLQIGNLQATTPATQLRASGALTSSSALTLSFATTDLKECSRSSLTYFPPGRRSVFTDVPHS